MTQSDLIILIADDDPEDLELLQEAILSVDPGAEISTVNRGSKVIDHLKACTDSELPCLVILDYNMPEMTGAQVLQVLCNHKRYSAIPKVILSTSHAPAHVKECLNNGAMDYFVKPSSVKALQETVEKMIALCSQKSAG